jgi:membrane protease YdiL (CAAX protease family)
MIHQRAVRRHVVILSPVVMIAVCHAVQRAGGSVLGVWAWVPTMMVFWACIAAVVGWSGGAVRDWLRPPQGHWLWSALALGVGVASVREFVSGWRVLESPSLFWWWLGFGLVNPWFEEAYWRGLLIDATRGWVGGLGVVYSTLLFALSHPAVWGVHSIVLRHPAALVGLALVGAVWGLAYWRTGSLRWTIAGHACANLLGLAVPILMNAYVPPGLR